MKKFAGVMLSMAAFGLVADYSTANDEDKPREGQRDGERGREGRGRGQRDGDRGPLDGEGRGRGNPLMAALDTDRNGVIDAKEIENAVAALRKLDRNEDGKLTAEEIGGRPPGDRPERGRPGRDGDGRPSPEQMMARFKEADTNEDGKLSKEEAPGRLKEGFARLDADESGFIEKSEFEVLIKRIQEGGGRPPGAGRGRDGDRPRDDDRPRDGGRGGKGDRPESE